MKYPPPEIQNEMIQEIFRKFQFISSLVNILCISSDVDHDEGYISVKISTTVFIFRLWHLEYYATFHQHLVSKVLSYMLDYSWSIL